MAYEEPSAETLQYKLHRKDSKLRRAVTFFKHLGMKSCSRHKSSGSSTLESFDTWLAKRKRFEMEDTSHDDDSSPRELADTKMGTPGHRPSPEKQSKTIYEMEGTMLYNPRDLDDLPYYSRETSTVVEPCELDVGNLAIAKQSNGTTESSHGSLTDFGAQFEVAQLSTEPWEEMLVSPISAVQSAFPCQSAGINTPCHTERALVSPTSSNSDTALSSELNQPDWSQAKIDPILNGSLLSSGCDDGLNYGVTSSTQSQVEELRETVRVLNEEWIRRCHSSPDLVLRASGLSPRSIFVTGISTLQHVFRGVLPRTLEAVYALAHIACASAYIMHGNDTSHCWNEFFQDILNWQHMMLNDSDARTFIQLINLLWWPQGPSAKLSCGDYFLDETSGTLVPLRKPTAAFDASSSTETNDTGLPPWSSASMSLVTSLKTGVVLRECSRFLDEIEYSNIMERSKNYPTRSPWYAQNHVTNIEEMLKTIINPLQSCDGIEALRGSIRFVAAELQSGSLRSVREVEVSLISNGKLSCPSSKVYKKYLDAIASICDRTMHEAGLNWRDRCYATHLDMIKVSVVELAACQRLEQAVPRHRRCTKVDETPYIRQTLVESNLEPSCTERQTLIDSSPSTMTSSTFTNASSPITQPSSTTTPESSFSAPSPSSNTIVTHCPLCTAQFTGSLRDRSSNLRRHMRTTRNHGNFVGLLCTVPGCDAVISRSDNLVKHIRTVHEGDTSTLLRRQGARKRRRDGDTAE